MITLPSARPGYPNSRKLRGKTPFLAQFTSLLSRVWPHQRRHTPRMARAYWDFRDQLSTDGGDTQALYVIIEVFSATGGGDPKT